MLVAGATLGLLAPTVAQASDVINLDEINNYSSSQRFDKKTFTNPVNEEVVANDDPELQENNFEAGSFSETTTLDSKAIFAVGALDNESGDITEATMFNYTYQMNLNTSFTGDDNLYVRLKSGNSVKNVDPFATAADGSYLSSTNTNGDVLKVDKIWYEFPIAEKHTVWIGPRIENYYMHGASPSIYSPTLKQFKLGGNGAAYGASTDRGVGWAYNADNGFSISSNIVSKGGITAATSTENLAIATLDADDIIGVVGDGVAANGDAEALAAQEDENEEAVVITLGLDATTTTGGEPLGLISDEDPSTVGLELAYTTDSFGVSAAYTDDDAGGTEATYYSFQAAYTPDAPYSVSAGMEFDDDDASSYFVGVTTEAGVGSLSVGMSTQGLAADHEDNLQYEVAYSYPVNDGMTITPGVFIAEDATEDEFGVVVTTSFSF